MKMKLLKDIVIPAGTILTEASRKTERHGPGHLHATIGLSDNTSGDFTYMVDECDQEVIDEYFGPEDAELSSTSQSLIPMMVVDNEDSTNVVQLTVCDSISGGADEIEDMPRELHLIRTDSNGEVGASYVHSVEVARMVADIVKGQKNSCDGDPSTSS